MRKKRILHDKIVDKYKNLDFINERFPILSENDSFSIKRDAFKKSNDASAENGDHNDDDEIVYDDQDLVIKVTNDNDESNNKNDKLNGEKKPLSKVEKRKMSKSVIDEEHYIPYKPKNYNTEKA